MDPSVPHRGSGTAFRWIVYTQLMTIALGGLSVAFDRGNLGWMPQIVGELLVAWAGGSVLLYPAIVLGAIAFKKIPGNRVAMLLILEGALLFAHFTATLPLVQ